jgi:small subunit ribosomal protein S18
MAKKKRNIRKQIKSIAPKECWFCKEKKEPTYADLTSLSRFLTERGKINPRSRNGLCEKHQNKMTAVVKHARYLAMLNFIVKV